MLLFLSQEHDLHCDWIEAECRRRGVDYLRLCTERFPQDVRLVLEPARGDFPGRLLVGEREIPLAEVVGLWFRRPAPVTLDPDIPDGLRPFSRAEAEEALAGLYRALYDRRWVSPPHRVDAAGYKIHQLRLAVELGFRVAPTLVTNDPAAVSEFFHRCGERMIYKPLRFVPIFDDEGNEFGIYTSLVTRQELEASLESVRLTPCLFQQLIPKQYELRVNIIGERVWAAAIYSQERGETSLDCRHDLESLRHTAVVLPPALEERCLKLHRRLGLRMSNLDVIVTPDGEHYFLELNPNGQFLWIEQQTGLPLCAALVDELLGVDTLADHPYLRDRGAPRAAVPVAGAHR
jgi:glutathione synthase/RimK-type ligase-like ATP-grasp enzyme